MAGASDARLPGLTAASLTDAMARLSPHCAHIHDLVSPTPGKVLFGRAATIRYVPYRDDVAAALRPDFARSFYEAVTGAFEETVLVLNNPCRADTSIGGGVKFSRLHYHRLAGLLTDGRIRDFHELASYSPVFYCAGEAVAAGSRALMPIAVNVPVSLSGAAIMPGDYIYADAAGAVVIPAIQLDRALDLAREIDAQDQAFLESIPNENPDTVRRLGSDEN